MQYNLIQGLGADALTTALPLTTAIGVREAVLSGSRLLGEACRWMHARGQDRCSQWWGGPRTRTQVKESLSPEPDGYLAAPNSRLEPTPQTRGPTPKQTRSPNYSPFSQRSESRTTSGPATSRRPRLLVLLKALASRPHEVAPPLHSSRPCPEVRPAGSWQAATSGACAFLRLSLHCPNLNMRLEGTFTLRTP